MKDDVLGELREDGSMPGTFSGKLTHAGTTIEFSLRTDSASLEECIGFAREAVKRLAQIDLAARKVAVRDLLETYNDGWREYQQADAQGNVTNFSNPLLSADQFMAKLSLRSLGITGDELCSLGYGDAGLFWNHAIFVEFFDGTTFKSAHAELFG